MDSFDRALSACCQHTSIAITSHRLAVDSPGELRIEFGFSLSMVTRELGLDCHCVNHPIGLFFICPYLQSDMLVNFQGHTVVETHRCWGHRIMGLGESNQSRENG